MTLNRKLLAITSALAFVACLVAVAPSSDNQTIEVASTGASRTTTTTVDLEPAQREQEVRRFRQAQDIAVWNEAVRFHKAVSFAQALNEHNAEVERQRQAKAAEEEQRRREAAAAAAVTTTQPPAATPPAPAPSSGGTTVAGIVVCNGSDLPPCYVVKRESGFNPTAKNSSSSACGLYQFINSTWAGFQGYPTACSAPVAVQVAKARALWAGGAGCSHWMAC